MAANSAISVIEGVTQTILHEADAAKAGVFGNCLQAAVATVFALPIDAVPHFVAFDWWPQALSLWAYGRGFRVLGYTTEEIPDWPTLMIVGGKSPRGVAHVVVGQLGQVVWDPHPSRDGLESVRDVTWFEPIPDDEPGIPVLFGPVVQAASVPDHHLRAEYARRCCIDPPASAGGTP